MERTDSNREAHIRRMEQEAKAERDKAKQRTGIDREVENELQTVRPGSDAPSRAGISPTGTGADDERG
jgi:hypothetical protein